MSLSDTRREEMRRVTHDAAIAFVEDMDHIRGLIAQKEISRTELRHLSAILRRLLVEGDISNIAAPRMGRMEIKAPDNNPIYKNKNLNYLHIFVSGRANIFGWKGVLIIWVTPPGVEGAGMFPGETNFDPSRTIDLPLKNFLSQKVIFSKGQWVSRKAVIKYVAQVMSGVHSGAPKTPDDIFLDRIRQGNSVSKSKSGKSELWLRKRETAADNGGLVYRKDEIDMTLIEILATARFLAASPDIAALEKMITEAASPPAT